MASKPYNTAVRIFFPGLSPASANTAGITTHPGCVTEPRCRSSVSRICVSPPNRNASRPASSPWVLRHCCSLRPASVLRPAMALQTASSAKSAARCKSESSTCLPRISAISCWVSVIEAYSAANSARSASPCSLSAGIAPDENVSPSVCAAGATKRALPEGVATT